MFYVLIQMHRIVLHVYKRGVLMEPVRKVVTYKSIIQFYYNKLFINFNIS